MNRDLEEILQSKGLKATGQRKLIMQVIFESDDHPNVEEVFNRASERDSSISLATVYRTVNILENYGIIEKLDFLDGKARYEPKNAEDDHHHHLIDIESGEIIEFKDKDLEELKIKIAQKLGYELVDHRLELFGKKL